MVNVYGCMWLREKKREGGMCDRGKERRGAGMTSGVLSRCSDTESQTVHRSHHFLDWS